MLAPLVSIVTPTLNPGLRLERCIASVRRQTYSRIEHVVIDGGSSDQTLERLQASEVRWISEPDEGQASAINKGWRLANGDILGWLNADDELLPDAVQSVVAAFSSQPAVDWVVGRVEIREGQRGFVRRPSDPARPLRWAAQNLAAQPGSFVSRRALERIGYLDEELDYMMDFDLWVRLVDAGLRGKIVPRILAVFEVHAGSKSGSLSHSDFVMEEALVRLRTGRSRSGAAAIGRAAAIRAWESDVHDWHAVQQDVQQILKEDGFQRWTPDPNLIEAGFRAESLLIAIQGRRVALALDAASSTIWRCPEARARVAGSISRAWARGRYRALHR